MDVPVSTGKGWTKLPSGEWVPDAHLEKGEGNKQTPAADPLTVDLSTLDVSLEASHMRITRVLAAQSARLEIQAATGLTADQTSSLGELAKVWRTLEANIEKLAEKAIEKAIKRELARLGKDERDGLDKTDPTAGE